MKLYKQLKYLYVVLIGFVLTGLSVGWVSCSQSSDTDEDIRRVVVFHSYYEDFYWNTNLTKGIVAAFKYHDVKVDFQTVYLHDESLSVEQQHRVIKEFLDDYYVPDLILVCDDQATSLLLTSDHPLTYKVPIVFSGVDYFDEEWLNGRTNVTGYTSRPDYAKCVELIYSLYPDMEGLAFDVDDSYQSRRAVEEFKLQMPTFSRQVDVKINNMDQSLGRDFIWSATFVNKYPHIMPVWSRFYSSRARDTEVPFFAVNNEGLGQGYLGGYMTLPFDQTYQAAETGIKILSGEPIAGFPIRQSEQYLVFDWRQMQKCHIREDQLPADVIIVNKGFWDKHKKELIAFSAVLGLLIIGLFVLLTRLYKSEKKKKSQTQQELQEHRNKLKIAMSSIREGVVSIDRNMNVFAINPAALQWLQLKGNDHSYIGHSILSLMDISDTKKDFLLQTEIRKVFNDFKSVILDSAHMISIENNYIFPINGSISPIYQNEELYGAVIVFRDITEELAQKEFLGLTLGVGDVSSWRLDLVKKRIVFDADFLKKNEIYDNGAHYIELDTLREMIHEDDRQGWDDANQQLVAGFVDTLRYEMRVDFNNGKGIQWWELRFTVLKPFSSNDPPAVFGLIRNIEKSKQTLIALERARDKAQLSDRLKSAFLANMSHEIRTPLNAIVGFSNVLTSGENFEPEERQIFIETIRNNCNLLLALISDVLDLAQIETGSMLFKEEICDLNEFIGQIIITQRVIIPEYLDIVGQVPPETTFIVTDKLRLNQVITNLINNAVKFTEKGKVTVGYTKDEDFIHFFVEDTGKGIPEDDLNNIFERFFKKDDFKQGAGLGLSICRMIVDRFEGTIEVTSKVGVGSRFIVNIPYIRAASEEDETKIFTNSNTYKFYNMNMETNDGLKQDKVTLLIAEDEESNYLLLKTILQKHCNLIRAKTGKEALEKFQEQPVDLVMLDIKMPEMTGIEALKEIRKLSATIPVIMQSAYVFDSDMESARQAGASDFITKPINLKILKETLSKYCPSLTW